MAHLGSTMSTPSFRTIGITLDPVMREHRTSPGHPERPDRYDAVAQRLTALAQELPLRPLPTRDAQDALLQLVHTPEYIRLVREECAMGRYCLSTGDTDICPESEAVARRATGNTLAAVDAVLRNEVDAAFCPVRPPGHHAESDRGRGFCIYNHIAVAARYAQAQHGIERILIADWDIHHGNGTQQAFYEDPTVFYFSTHQWPAFPGTGLRVQQGLGPGKDTTINCPFGIGTGATDLLEAVRTRLAPAMNRFNPELVLISAGFDGEAGDYLGGFCLQPLDYARLTSAILAATHHSAQGRCVSVLEGGYRLDGLQDCLEAHIRAMAIRSH